MKFVTDISNSNSGKVAGHFIFSSYSLEKDKAKTEEALPRDRRSRDTS